MTVVQSKMFLLSFFEKKKTCVQTLNLSARKNYVLDKARLLKTDQDRSEKRNLWTDIHAQREKKERLMLSISLAKCTESID